LGLTPDRIAEWFTYYVVLLFSVSVHESAHAWTALQMGDDTASSQGRISLNPLVHIDPIGTVVIPLFQIFGGGIPLLGWAKPTPVGAHNFRKLARGHVLVAGAGPFSNLLLAFLFTFGLAVPRLLGFEIDREGPIFAMLLTGLQMNVSLAVFNLLPLPPLDGSWIASWGLPRSLGNAYDRIVEPFGPWLLLILVMTGVLRVLLYPVFFVIRILLGLIL